MNARYYIIASLAVVLACTSCSDEVEPRGPVQYCVRVAWENGRAEAGTRAMATNVLAPGSGDISIAYADYPSEVIVEDADHTQYKLSKSFSTCSEHNGFYQYSSDNQLDQQLSGNFRFTASATIDDADVLTGIVTEEDFAKDHLQFRLHHTKALVRFGFKVDAKYSQIRQILLQEVKFNGVALSSFTPRLITTTSQLMCYTYILPSNVAGGVSTGSPNTLSCKYTVYDKDAIFEGDDQMTADQLAQHVTRPDVVAQNTFTFGGLTKGPSAVTTIEAGKYYDLQITLNPDYLYVLSDHDDKQHLTIN